MRHDESHIQEQVVTWLRLQFPYVFFTGGFAGEKMKIPAAIRRKRMGYLAGSPDLLILEPKGIYHGLMVELKSVNGVLSDNQKACRTKAELNGYRYIVCHALESAQEQITAYLEEAQ